MKRKIQIQRMPKRKSKKKTNRFTMLFWLVILGLLYVNPILATLTALVMATHELIVCHRKRKMFVGGKIKDQSFDSLMSGYDRERTKQKRFEKSRKY